jgi:hypothetical protein
MRRMTLSFRKVIRLMAYIISDIQALIFCFRWFRSFVLKKSCIAQERKTIYKLQHHQLLF